MILGILLEQILFNLLIFLLYLFRNSRNSDDKKETLTVVFHAILSDKFDFDDETKVVIRGQDPVFHGWEENSVVLKTER